MPWNVHYRCEFALQANDTPNQAWDSLIRNIRNWIKHRPEQDGALDPSYWGDWFFSGGEWKSSQRQGFGVQVAIRGVNVHGLPKHWVAQYFHPCTHPARRWKIDIAVNATDENFFIFNMNVFHQISAGYVGELPSDPPPTVPLLVKNLIKSDYWNAFSGSEQLSVFPQVLTVGEGMSFREKLADPDRQCPIVVMNCLQSETNDIKPTEFAWTLAGAANIYTIDDETVNTELIHCIGSYSCLPGRIRIYLPNLQIDNPQDASRHRFITNRTISKIGKDNTLSLLVDSLTRRKAASQLSDIKSIYDIRRLERDDQIALFKVKATENEQYYLSHIQTIEEELKEANITISELQDQLTESETKRHEDFSNFQFLKETLKSENTKYKEACKSCSKIQSLQKFPTSLLEVVITCKEIFSNQLVFSDAAVKSAQDADFDDYTALWNNIHAVATKLHSYIFSQSLSLGNAAKKFQADTAIRIALTESSTTNSDKKLMAKREQIYEGKAYDCSPHITLSKKKAFLRIHFCPINDEKKILISHCGDHLETAGTRRRGY